MEGDPIVRELLARIADNTSLSWSREVWYSFWRGAFFAVGSVAIITAASWILSLLGFLPGFGDIAHYLRGAIQTH